MYLKDMYVKYESYFIKVIYERVKRWLCHIRALGMLSAK